MSGEITNNPVAEPLRKTLDNAANDIDGAPWFDGCDSSHGGFIGALNQQAHLLANISAQKSGIGIPMNAANVGRNVDIADIPVMEHRAVGDSVADHFVDGGAQTLGVAAVSEGGGVGAVITEILVTDGVEGIGGDTGPNRFTDFDECISRYPPGYAHAFNCFFGLNVGTAEGAGAGFAHVFGAGNVHRNCARWTKATRCEGSARVNRHASSLITGSASCRRSGSLGSASDFQINHLWDGSDMSWYYCLEHQGVEPEDGCPNSERMGPYATETEAEHAMERAAERNAAFDADDD